MNDGKGQSLGELVTLVRGNTYKSRLLGKSGPVLLGLASIQRHGGFRDDKLKCYAGPSKQEHLIGPGELFVSLKDVTQSAELLGAVAMVPPSVGEGRLTQDTVHLKMTCTQPSKGFIYWSLRTPQYRRYCLACSMGTTNLSLSRNDFLDWRLPEVNNSSLTLVSLLEDLEAKIDLLKRQNNTLEGMAEALFRQWFIEEAQDDWPEVQFQEIVKVSRGVSYSGKLLGDGGIPMHNLKSASVGGGYRYDGIKFFQGDVKPEKILSPGEILMVNTDMTPDNRIIGQPIRVPSFYPKSICSHHMYHLGFECSATRTFVYQYFRIEENRELLANYSNGTTVSMLGSKVLKTVEIPLPPIQLREAFMEYRRDIDYKLDSNEMKIRNLTAQRDTLLPKLMSGEVRVQMD